MFQRALPAGSSSPSARPGESDTPLRETAHDLSTTPFAKSDIVDALPAVKPPHPGFWMSVLWCIVFLSVTQTPGAVVTGVEMVIGLAQTVPQPAAEEAADVKHSENEPPLTASAKRPTTQKPLDVKQATLHFFQSEVVRNSLIHALAITEICVVLFSWGLIRLLVGKDWKRKLALRRPGLAHSIMALLGLPALWVLGVGLYVTAKQVLHIPGMEDLLKLVPGMGDANIPLMEELMKSIRQWPLPIAVLVIGLGPGIGEELWCRGFLGRGLVGRFGVVVGIAMTSFFFGLIHLDPAQGVMAMMMGVCLHFVYQTTRSLWLSILLHFLNNSVSVVVLRFPELDAIEQQPGSYIPLFIGATILAAAVAFAFYQSRARLAPDTPGARYYWHPDYPGVEYPPPGSGTKVIHPWPSIPAVGGVAVGLLFFAVTCYTAFQRFTPTPH